MGPRIDKHTLLLTLGQSATERGGGDESDGRFRAHRPACVTLLDEKEHMDVRV